MLCVTFYGLTVIELEKDCEFQELVCIYSVLDQRHIGSPWGSASKKHLDFVMMKLVTHSISTQESLGTEHALYSSCVYLWIQVDFLHASPMGTLNSLFFCRILN